MKTTIRRFGHLGIECTVVRNTLVALGCGALWSLVAAQPRPAAAECTENSLACEGEVTVSDASTGSVSCAYSLASYELPEGRVAVAARGPSCELCLSGASVAAQDVFEITGVPTSVPIACMIRLRLTGFLARPSPNHHHYGAFSTAALGLTQHEWSDQERSAWDGWWPAIDESIELDVVLEANTPFTVSYSLYLVAQPSLDWSEIRGELLFFGLPPEARLQSCNGFAPAPVAKEEATWGDLKSLYRD